MQVGDILNAAVRFFEEDGLSFIQLKDEPTLKLDFQGDTGQWLCFALAREEQAQFVFYSVFPVNVPEAKRAAVVEFLNRANYDLYVGNFEMDWTSGEVRCRTSIDLNGEQLSRPVVQQLVYVNVRLMDYYLPGIMNVMFGQVSPTRAIAALDEEE